ncbi:hypothetical protein T03_18004 [Trichinella britovi]|uniref:Uncharacterized protein n=1 Tax=Trichinella britovi TaxID=45882 RepID=A0A0V1B663_TRIBR|nr:hypothetical protein T03_12486 [Trichinella britovi]KRY32510.1 hypothetical protein T03_18004 [Trichinella britovi]
MSAGLVTKELASMFQEMYIKIIGCGECAMATFAFYHTY